MRKTEKQRTKNVQSILEEELVKLKSLIPFDEELSVYWVPRSNTKLSGEVIGKKIYVYDENVCEALNTLKHEYLDCLLTRELVNPLVALVNVFINLRTKEIYIKKERVVTRLLALI